MKAVTDHGNKHSIIEDSRFNPYMLYCKYYFFPSATRDYIQPTATMASKNTAAIISPTQSHSLSSIYRPSVAPSLAHRPHTQVMPTTQDTPLTLQPSPLTTATFDRIDVNSVIGPAMALTLIFIIILVIIVTAAVRKKPYNNTLVKANSEW